MNATPWIRFDPRVSGGGILTFLRDLFAFSAICGVPAAKTSPAKEGSGSSH